MSFTVISIIAIIVLLVGLLIGAIGVGGVLLVPQFTLYANTRRGRRPDFGEAMSPDQARSCFEKCLLQFEAAGLASVASGRFGADMQVHLVNDGPVTLELEFHKAP